MWHCARFFKLYFGFLLSVSFHQCSIFMSIRRTSRQSLGNPKRMIIQIWWEHWKRMYLKIVLVCQLGGYCDKGSMKVREWIRTLVEWYWQGKTEVLEEKSLRFSLFPTRIWPGIYPFFLSASHCTVFRITTNTATSHYAAGTLNLQIGPNYRKQQLIAKYVCVFVCLYVFVYVFRIICTVYNPDAPKQHYSKLSYRWHCAVRNGILYIM